MQLNSAFCRSYWVWGATSEHPNRRLAQLLARCHSSFDEDMHLKGITTSEDLRRIGGSLPCTAIFCHFWAPVGPNRRRGSRSGYAAWPRKSASKAYSSISPLATRVASYHSNASDPLPTNDATCLDTTCHKSNGNKAMTHVASRDPFCMRWSPPLPALTPSRTVAGVQIERSTTVTASSPTLMTALTWKKDH